MTFDAKLKLYRCDHCRRAMNPTDRLTDLRKPGERYPMSVCPSGGCWEAANEAGYYGPYQDRPPEPGE